MRTTLSRNVIDNMDIIKLHSDEIWPFLNILNEVCNGININNFEKCIGTKREIIIDLFNKTSYLEKDGELLELSALEFKALNNCFHAVVKEIEDWEFQTRIGITPREADEIHKKWIPEAGLACKQQSY